MPRSRPFRPQRQRIFLGCEGESERGYATVLARLVEQRHQNVHLDTVPLGGGDPLSMVERAIAFHRRRLARGEYAYRAILLDADALGRALNRDEQARGLAIAHSFDLIWQEPSHEALLLLHLDEGPARRPQTSTEATHTLLRLWPEYQKALPATRLSQRIDRSAVLRARALHAGLRRLLDRLDFGVDEV
jgi:hypothetical protein